MGSKSSPQPTTTTTVQKSDPWAGQQPYLTDVFQQAQQQYQSSQPQYFPGATSAPIDPATQQAQQYALGQAQGPQQALGGAAQQSAMFNLNDAKYVESNPYLQQAIQAAFRPTIQAFTDPGGPLQQARTGFIDSGQYGGSRHGIAEGIMYGRLGDTLAGTAAGMANQGYESGLKASLQQQALLPQVQQAGLAPATTMEAVGQQREAYAQQLLNDAIARWGFEQNIEPAKLAQYASLVSGGYGGESSGQATYPGAAQPNKTMGVLGGAATGAGAGFMIGGPVGAGVGGVAGALLSLFAQ